MFTRTSPIRTCTEPGWAALIDVLLHLLGVVPTCIDMPEAAGTSIDLAPAHWFRLVPHCCTFSTIMTVLEAPSPATRVVLMLLPFRNTRSFEAYEQAPALKPCALV